MNVHHVQKEKHFSVKVAQVGKIITVGLVGGSAIFLGEVFEKFLFTTVPGMQIEIPLIGTLANMIGLFLSSLVSGLVGAIALNLIDKFISRKAKEEIDQQIINKKNKIIVIGNDQNDICLFQQPFGMKIAVGEMCDNELLALSNRQVLLNDLVFLLKECMK